MRAAFLGLDAGVELRSMTHWGGGGGAAAICARGFDGGYGRRCVPGCGCGFKTRVVAVVVMVLRLRCCGARRRWRRSAGVLGRDARPLLRVDRRRACLYP